MASIPSGASTLFIQSWTPIGWTRNTTYDDHGLRVTDTPGSDVNGSASWTNRVSSGTPWQWFWPATVNGADGSALSVNPAVGELASHTHTLTTGYISFGWSNMRQYPGGAASGRAGGSTPVQTTSGSAGTGSPTAHTHPLAFVASPGVSLNVTMQVKYIDAILATRD